MSESANLSHIVRQLLNEQPLAVLATHGEAGPHTSLIAFAVTDDLRHLLFATQEKTRKFANIIADGRVSLLADNRSNKNSDIQEAVAITIAGTAQEAADGEREQFLSVYLRKNQHLSDFVCSPGCVIVSVKVTSYYIVRRFQEVSELRMG